MINKVHPNDILEEKEICEMTMNEILNLDVIAVAMEE